MKYVPWKIGPRSRAGCDVFDSKGACVASYCTAEDARLIAAAPELLAALQNLVACCEKHRAFTHTGNTVTGNRMYEARAAIARATHPSHGSTLEGEER